jgi:hypothetical protein
MYSAEVERMHVDGYDSVTRAHFGFCCMQPPGKRMHRHAISLM